MSFLNTFSYGQTLATIIIIIIFFLIEILLRRLKKRKRKEFIIKQAEIESLELIEDLSIEHYKQVQHIDIIRFVLITIGAIVILGAYNVQIFNVLAVATGAFIFALRESFASLVAYFFILSNFKLGDDIRVGTFLGEIVRIQPLYTAIAGKDDNGEYNSRLHHIPNFMFFNQIIDEQQLKSGDYGKVVLFIYYNGSNYSDSFEVWIQKLKNYLGDLLPKRPLKKVGYFKGYAGIKYKISYDYNDKGEVVTRLSFVARSSKISGHKESIIKFVESLKEEGKTIEKTKSL